MEERKETYKQQINKLINPYIEKYQGEQPVITIIQPENMLTVKDDFYNSLPREIKDELFRLVKEYNE